MWAGANEPPLPPPPFQSPTAKLKCSISHSLCHLNDLHHFGRRVDGDGKLSCHGEGLLTNAELPKLLVIILVDGPDDVMSPFPTFGDRARYGKHGTDASWFQTKSSSL